MKEEKANKPQWKQTWKECILYSILGILFIGQIILCLLFYNWAGLDVLLYLDFLIMMKVAANSVFAVIAKTPSYLCALTYSKVRKMSDMFQLKGGICELCSDIPPNWRDMRSEWI